MIPILKNRAAEIEALCRRFHVKRLDVFGSAAREHDFTDSSDIDLLVEYEEDHRPVRFKQYLELRGELESLLGRKVDLLMAGAVQNPYFRASIERSRQSLHAA